MEGAHLRREARREPEGRVLLRVGAKHALREGDGLESARFLQPAHVGVHPDGSVVCHLKEPGLRRVATVGWVLDGEVAAGSVGGEE